MGVAATSTQHRLECLEHGVERVLVGVTRGDQHRRGDVDVLDDQPASRGDGGGQPLDRLLGS